MNIPHEVFLEANAMLTIAGEYEAYDAIAEWARKKAFEEAAKLVDSEGYYWSGAQAHDFFRIANDIRALAEETE